MGKGDADGKREADGAADEGRSKEDRRTKALRAFGLVVDGRRFPSPLFGRDAEVERVVDQIERVGRSFLLVGPPGAGKTTILRTALHALASRDANAWRFVEVTCGTLIAGQVYFGAWQENVNKLIAAAPRRSRSGIWFGDPANLFSTGKTSRTNDSIGEYLSPPMERGDLIVFGEATPEVHGLLLASAPAVERLFDVIHVEPQGREAAAETVRLVAAARAREAGMRRGAILSFDPETVERCIALGESYFPSKSRPAGAIRLVEAVLEDAVLGRYVPAGLGKAADLTRSGVIRKGSATEVVGGGIPASGTPVPAPRVAIPPKAVIEALCAVTGAPRALLDDSLPLPPAEVRRFFESRLVGQRRAIEAVVDLVAMIKAGLVDPSRPAGVLLFVGPTGVGKTELAKVLAEFVFGSADRLVRLDMSEFARPDGHGLLVQGTEDGKGLLAGIKRQPFSVILFDEIEKAHPSIFDLLLQLFDAGRLSTPSGETVNFTQSVIILTSNLGAGEPPPAGFGFREAEPPPADEWIRGAVGEFFRPELVNRLGRIVVFDPLDREQVRQLAQRELGAVLLRGGITRRRLQVDVDRAVVDLLAGQGYEPRFGARPLKRAVERMVLGPLAHVLSEMPAGSEGTVLQILPAGDRIRVVPVRDDRRARHHEAVSIDDPFDGTPTKATAATLRSWLADLADEVEWTRSQHDRSGLAARRSAAVAATSAPDFWDDPDRARATLSELYRAERAGEAVRDCVDRARRVAEDATRAGRRPDHVTLARLATEIARCRRQAAILRYAILCDAPLDRADAFVVHDAVDPGAREHVRALADCHAAWARRLGFDVVSVHEEGAGKGGMKQVVLQINGVAVFGMLAAEDGLHEFLPDAKSERRLVRVTVMPVPAAVADAGETVVEVVPRGAKRPEVRARRRGAGPSITIRPEADGRAAEIIARELLAAETARQERLRSGAAPQEIVRRWWLGSRPTVRDPRTGAAASRVKDILAGDIDRFLVAYLEARGGGGERPSA